MPSLFFSFLLVSCVSLSSPLSVFLYHLQTKIGLAAFLWAFCPCSGRRLAHRGSCYNFHFLNVFLFFFLHGTKTCILSRSAVWRWRVRGARWQLRFRLLSLQRWQTNKAQTARSCRVLVEGSSGVVWNQWGCGSCVGSTGALVTWAISEPRDRWGDAPPECEVDFIIPYPIPLPLVVSATLTPASKALESRACVCVWTHKSVLAVH